MSSTRLQYGTKRDVGPLLQWIREKLRGRDWTREQLRSQDKLSPRPYPPGNIPQGPNDKVSNNYYYTRDARRDAFPPLDLTNTSKLLSSGQTEPGKDAGSALAKKEAPTPGKVYKYSVYDK